MSINFPSSLDSFPNPTSTDLLENATLGLDHDQQHSNANDAIEALEAKVGANSSAITTSHDYKLSLVTNKAANIDTNSNITANNYIKGYTTTVTAAGTTTLTNASTYLQYFTGTSNQNVVLPVATTMTQGQQFYIKNTSTAAVTIQTSGGNNLFVLAGSPTTVVDCIVTCINPSGGTGTASWSASTKSVVSASGKSGLFNNRLTFAGTDDTTMTFPSTSQTIAGLTSTQTFTNKRVTPRTGTTTSSATPTINTDNVDFYSITAQSGDITSMTTNLTGTPDDGQTFWLAMTATSGTPAITWGSKFEASSLALPTGLTTTRQDFRFIWNTTTSKWRFVGYA